MYIDLSAVYFVFGTILSILCIALLILLIILVVKLIKIASNVGTIINKYKENIDSTLEDLPTITENVVEISEGLKDVSEAVTETTADLIVAKENFTSQIDFIKEIIAIISKLFFNKDKNQ